ncbi:MAG: TolC family protein [Brevinema sp.]
MHLFYRLVVTILGLTTAVYSQELSTILPLSQYVDAVMTQLPDIQLNKLKVYDAEISRLRSSKILDYNFEARLGIFQNTEFTGNVESPFNLIQGLEVGGKLSRAFPSFGGRFELDIGYRQFSATSFSGAGVGTLIEDAIFRIPVLTLRASIPLLRNVAGILDRYPLTIAGIDSKIQQWVVEEENAWIVSNYKKFYLQWFVAGDMMNSLHQALSNAIELDVLARAQRRTGFIDDADYQNIQILRLEIENELLTAQNLYTNLQEQIAILTGMSNIVPNPQEWEILNQQIDNEDFKSVPFDSTRQSTVLELMFQAVRHGVYAYQNNRLPEFNILGSIAMEVYTTNNPPRRPEEVIVIPAYYTGFEIKYPFGDHESKAQRLQILRKQRELEYLSKKYIKEYAYKTDSKVRSLAFHRAKTQNRIAAGKALEARYVAQRRRYGQGRETLTALVDTRNQILRNSIDEADLKLQLVYDYFEYLVLNNKDEVSTSYQEGG